MRLPSRRPGRQGGAVLLFALVLLVVLLLTTMALLRSSMSDQLLAGNIGFKRDLQMQGQRGIEYAETLFSGSGLLASSTNLVANQSSVNYSATVLSAGANGIPTILLDDTAWAASGMSAADISDSNTALVDPVTGQTLSTGITMRYVIDRMCSSTGTANPSTCVVSAIGQDTGGTSWQKKAGGSTKPVYRITVRVDGPHNTQTFLQQLVSF